MKARTIGLAIVPLLILAMVAAVVPAGVGLAQSTWYVSTTGNDTTGDGSSGNPWRTIQYAVDQATNGDTVEVAAGQYDENVTVGKALTLNGAQADVDARGRTGDETVVVGDPTALYASSTVSGVAEINGFTIKGYRAAVDIESAQSRFLCNIVEPTGPGAGSPPALVYIHGDANDVVVQYCDISPALPENWPSGANALRVGVTGPASVLVDSNRLHNASNYPSAPGAGLALYADDASTTITVTNNEMYKNGSDGMFTWNATFATLNVTDNEIYDNGEMGVKIWSGVTGDVNVNNNNIYGNPLFGVCNHATGPATVDATDNWWGHETGPYDPYGTEEQPPCAADPANGMNADGLGDYVSDPEIDPLVYGYVDYCGWWTAPSGEVETVSVPNTPTGPAYGDAGEVLTYCTGGAVSSMGHPVEYQFDWGDGSFSTWSSQTCRDNSWPTEDDYGVRARARCSLHPDIVSDWSGYRWVTIGDVVVSDYPPDPPTNLVATGISDTEIRLTWQDNSDNELGFRIERKNRPLGYFHEIDSVGENVMTYTDSDVITGQEYWYRVKAWNFTHGTMGEPVETFSAPSNEDSAIASSGGGGCFVATAAYGSYLEPGVQSLRSFRDAVLQEDAVGRNLVSTYYRTSPPFADCISRHPALKPAAQAALLPAVCAGTVAVDGGSTVKVAVLATAVMATALAPLWIMRKRKGMQRG